MIKNDYQFRLYFYMYILDSYCYHLENTELLQWLKNYLLTPGYRTSCINENGVRCSIVVHDFDVLYSIYLKLGDI